MLLPCLSCRLACHISGQACLRISLIETKVLRFLSRLEKRRIVMLLTVFGLSFSLGCYLARYLSGQSMFAYGKMCMVLVGVLPLFVTLFVCCTFRDDSTEWLYEVYDDWRTAGLREQLMMVRNVYMKYMTTEGLRDCGSIIRRYNCRTAGAAWKHLSKWAGILKFSPWLIVIYRSQSDVFGLLWMIVIETEFSLMFTVKNHLKI